MKAVGNVVKLLAKHVCQCLVRMFHNLRTVQRNNHQC